MHCTALYINIYICVCMYTCMYINIYINIPQENLNSLGNEKGLEKDTLINKCSWISPNLSNILICWKNKITFIQIGISANEKHLIPKKNPKWNKIVNAIDKYKSFLQHVHITS